MKVNLQNIEAYSMVYLLHLALRQGGGSPCIGVQFFLKI